MLTAARLFAPASEHTHSLLIQSDVTCLATLRVPAFDREELMVEVDGSPAQFEKFTAAKSGVGPDAVGLYPRRIDFIDELPKRQAICSAKTLQRVVAVRDIAQHLLTLLPGLLGEQCTDLPQ
jgi:hypothetical protein